MHDRSYDALNFFYDPIEHNGSLEYFLPFLSMECLPRMIMCKDSIIRHRYYLG